jgi:hypothetical protein
MKFIAKMTTMGDRCIIIVPMENKPQALKMKGKHIRVDAEEITI